MDGRPLFSNCNLLKSHERTSSCVVILSLLLWAKLVFTLSK
nr:MAG TPA: hypothetical protein [Caudoviricetes sp.]